MATVIKLKIFVDELENVLSQFDRIKVYRASTISGIYSEITTVATRIVLEQGKANYEFDDLAGDPSYWYKTAYYSTGSGLESSASDPQLGDDPISDLILSVAQLKAIYLFGIDLTNDRNEPYPEIMFRWGIRYAIAWLERELDIKIRPTPLVERYDYYRNDYQAWTFIRLRQAPIVKVNSVKVKWPSDETVIEFDPAWIQVRKEEGQVNIVPTSGTLSQVLLTAGGSFLPLIAAGRDFVPNILEVDYVAGFGEGEVPMDLRETIGKMAAFGPLNIAGDLIVGAGIASQSVGIDGLSQSINTTSSATNAGYGARLVQYNREIKNILPTLKRYYKGIRLAAL